MRTWRKWWPWAAVGMVGVFAWLAIQAGASRAEAGTIRSSDAPPGAPPRPTPGAGHQTEALYNPIPRTGDQKLLVLLADFSDVPGLFTGQAWQQFFFGAGGFDDYFREVSYDQLRYTGDIIGLQAGTPITNSAQVRYIRMPHPITYYADGQHGFNVDPGQFPQNNGGVVYHALQALDAAGFNFAPYANPGTNHVDNLVVIFGGSTFAYTQDNDNSLEATAYRLSWAGAPGGAFTATGGQTVDNYTFCPDQGFDLNGEIAYIGVCGHEHGHALGMGDLYDLSNTTAGAGPYDIMARGTFGASGGERPFHFGAFSKEYFGWLAPTVAPLGTSSYRLAPLETHAQAIRLNPSGTPNSPEYFLLENRQDLGFDDDWTGAGLCRGLLIWHIDRDIVDAWLYNLNTVSTAGGPPHQGAIVVEADGNFDLIQPPLTFGECSDTWLPGQTWNDSTTPNAHRWDGSASHLSVSVVSQCGDGSLILNVSVGTTTSHRQNQLSRPAGGVQIFLPLIQKQSC
jgi:immune inhibitor A